MKTNNTNPIPHDPATGKAASTQRINTEPQAPIAEKPQNVLQSWQHLRKLDNNLANRQHDDLPVD